MSHPRSHTIVPTHFALVDDIVEVDSRGRRRLLAILDCITCEAAYRLKDRTWNNIGDGAEFNATMVLSVELSALRRVLPDMLLDGQWLRFCLAGENHGPEFNDDTVRASFVDLGGRSDQAVAPRFRLSGVTPVGSPLKKLSLLTGLNSRKQEITSVLDRAVSESSWPGVRNVVAYDIGQGSAAALVDRYGRPRIYFDLGWPTSLNRNTRPAHPPSLFATDACPHCPCPPDDAAPVLLSHWDFDHWAYAIESGHYHPGKMAANITFKPAALARPWIVPKPPRIKNGKGLGATHMRLLTALPQRIVWPNRLHSVSFAAGIVTRTDVKKAATDRNNQGLAWFVKGPTSPDTILLPGDISFDHLRMPAPPLNITSMLASHHGGIVSGIASHLPKAPPGAALVLSVGAKNIHKHPAPAILAGYTAAGWSKQLWTSTRNLSCPSAPQQNGSVLMQLRSSDPRPHFHCACMHKGNLVPTQ